MIAAMWSGGKDSCLAVWRAINSGYSVDRLICMLNENKTSRAHGLNKKAISKQAEAVGIDVVFGSSTWEGYGEALKKVIEKLGVQKIVFGDIFLEEHRTWIEKFCGEIGVQPIFPLWGDDTLNLAREFVSEGFEAYIVAVRKDVDISILGRKFDHELVDLLVESGIDPCGENGEFHTFVVSGPLFKRRVEFMFGKTRENEKYVMLEIIV